MSDLSATNCGCGCDSNNGLWGGSNSCLWIIILLCCCGCGGNSFGRGDCGNDNCLWIILLLLLCGGNDCGIGC